MEEIKIRKAKEEDMFYIREKLDKYALDSDDASCKQFFVAKNNEQIVAFGRIIERPEFFEIASLGVDYYSRQKGIGKEMLSFLIKEVERRDENKPIYGVTSKMGFVINLGFREVSEYPDVFEHKKKHFFKSESDAKVVRYMPEGRYLR